MKGAYADIMRFGECSWCGGGYERVNYYIGPDSSARSRDFAAFEERLIAHKRKYFTHLPFPYVRQSDIHWKLFGPFSNDGNLDAAFWHEDSGSVIAESIAEIRATGDTLWLWPSYATQEFTSLSGPPEIPTMHDSGRLGHE